jgi:glycosyltransferase involved in cell wall biosynthesis
LCRQTNNDFEWLVIDDCSTDNTEDYIKSLRNSRFDIRYYKTPRNSGKHGAYNLAIGLSKGDLFICVDSDDYLTENAVTIIEKSSKELSGVGLIFPQICNKKINNCNWQKINNKYIDVIDTEELFGIRETAIVIKTNVLKNHSFPVYEKNGEIEKYCPETVLYNSFVDDGQFLAINEGFYISEYQENGLTNSIYKTWLNNPNSFIRDQLDKFKVYGKYTGLQRLKSRVICILELNSFCFKKRLNVLTVAPSKLLSTILYIPGIMVSFYRYGKG